MNTSRPIVSSSVETVEIVSSVALIRAARFPMEAAGRQALLNSVEAECGQIEQGVRRHNYSVLRQAEAAEALSAGRLAAVRADAAEAAAREQGCSGGSVLKTAIWGLCAAACFAAEFVLTWHALCFVLDVPRMSVLGVLLGLAPPSGLAVLEVFLARLFEDPWQKVREAGGHARRWVVTGAMAALLVAVAAGNVVTVLHLAKAREESYKAVRALNSESRADTAIDYHAIDQAVLWVSVLVTVDGAIFLLLSLREGAAAAALRRRRSRAARLRQTCAGLEEDHAKTIAAVECRREDWQRSPETAALDAQRYRAFCHHLLAQAEVAALLGKPVEELIDESLRLRMAA